MADNFTDMNINYSEAKRLRQVFEYMKTFQGIKDIDFLVLKAHVLIDHELKVTVHGVFRLRVFIG